MNAYATFAVAMAGGTLRLKDAIPLFSEEWQPCGITSDTQQLHSVVQGLTSDQKQLWKLYSRGIGNRPPLPPSATSVGPVLPAPWPRPVHRALKNDEARGCNGEGDSEHYKHLTNKQLPERLYGDGPTFWRGPYGEPYDLTLMLAKNGETPKVLKASAEVGAKSAKAMAQTSGGGRMAVCVAKASGDGGSSASVELATGDAVMTSEASVGGKASVDGKRTWASTSVEAGIPGTEPCRRGRGRGRMVQPFGHK